MHEEEENYNVRMEERVFRSKAFHAFYRGA
jgi:hypothetical protein